MCSLFFKKSLTRPHSIILFHLVISFNKLNVLFQCFHCRFQQVNICCSIGSISRPTPSHNNNAADQAIAMDSYQSFCRKLDIFFSGKQQGAIRTDQKYYSLLLKVSTSLSTFSTTRPFLVQQRKQMKSNNKFLQYLRHKPNYQFWQLYLS